MKFVCKLAAASVTVLLLLSLAICGVWAESGMGWREINGAVGESLYADYRRQVVWFDSKASYGWSEEGIDQVIETVMYPYSAKIALLSVKDDASYETEMRLLHEQGRAAGLLSWIYYTDEELHSAPAVRETYLALMDEIDPAINHDGDPTNDLPPDMDFFTAEDTPSLRTAEDCYREMTVAVFRQKIQDLGDQTGSAPDSPAVKGILSNAILHQLPDLSFRGDFYVYFDENDTENHPNYQGKTNGYQALYEETVLLVETQRNREATTRQLSSVFSKLYPDDSFLTTENEKISAFHTALATKKTIRELNAQLQTTILLLLRDLADMGADSYRTEYLLGSDLKQGLSHRVIAATVDTEALANVIPLFNGYTVELQKADAKDELKKCATLLKDTNPSYSAAQRNAVDALVAQYNENGAVFDTATQHNLELELTRAMRRLDLLSAYYQASAQLHSYLDGSAANRDDLVRLSEELGEEYGTSDRILASAGATSNPASLLAEAISLLADTVAEGEACAFQNAHATILGVTREQIRSADHTLLLTYRELLEAAIADAHGDGNGDLPLSLAAIAKMEAHTVPVLTSLGRSYLDVIQAQIAIALRKNTEDSNIILSLRKNLILTLQGKADRYSFTVDTDRGVSELAALPSRANLFLQSATEADSFLDHYCYGIDSAAKDRDMEAYCELAAQQILNGTLSAPSGILRLERMEAKARIRHLAEGHEELERIREILSTLHADLEGCSDEAAVNTYTENTVFLIENQITAEQYRQQIVSVLEQIGSMDFLTSEQRIPYETAANALRDYIPTIQNAQNKSSDAPAVEDAMIEFQNSLRIIKHAMMHTCDARAQAQDCLTFLEQPAHVGSALLHQWKATVQDVYTEFLQITIAQLSRSNTAHSELTEELLCLKRAVLREELTGVISVLKDKIPSYRYLNEQEKASYLSSLTTIKENAIEKSEEAVLGEEVERYLTEGLNALREQELACSARERENCYRTLLIGLHNSYSPNHYSAETQAKLTQTVKRYEKKLIETQSVAENERIYAEALALIGKEINLLQESQARNEEKLTEEYEALLKRSSCYSKENLSLLQDIYETALQELRAPRAVTDWQQVDLLVADAVLSLQEICLDRIYTADNLLTETPLTKAPSSYSPATEGYIAMIVSKNGLPYDTTLSVLNGNKNGVENRIQLALKENRLYPADGSDLGKDLLRRLKDAHLGAAWQITLDTAMLSSAERYTVSLLLPSHLREEALIGIVFLREDGSAEFYDVNREDDLLSFDTSHFSEFYLLCESTANLMPWIIALSILILCEVFALILLYRHRNRTEYGDLSSLPAVLLSPTLLKVYRPANGVGILWLLGGISLTLAAWISYLAVTQLRNKYTEPEYPNEDTDEGPDEGSLLEEQEEIFPNEPDPIPVLAAVPVRSLLADSGPLPQVTVAEAETLMTDESAREELNAESAAFVETEVHTGTKKAEINIDTIAQHFHAGDTVTLALLKEKKLIPSQTGFIKILARGSLDKPLTVIAQDFSIAALKMILLTGGTPIVSKPSLSKKKR